MNALIKLAFSDAGVGGVGCGGPSQQNAIGAVYPYVGCITGVTKGGAMLVVVLKGVNRDATVSCVVAIRILLCIHLQDGVDDGGVSCAWG